MTPILADVIVKNPCYGIEEGSWSWWLHGCWLFREQTILVLGVAALVALLLAWMVKVSIVTRRAA